MSILWSKNVYKYLMCTYKLYAYKLPDIVSDLDFKVSFAREIYI